MKRPGAGTFPGSDVRHPASALIVTAPWRFVTAANSSTEALAQHRWHWTLDESNPDRLRSDGERGAISEYARRVGRSQSVIYAQAHGYSLKAINPEMPLTEAIARAATSTERTEVVEAVAAATGKGAVLPRPFRYRALRFVTASCWPAAGAPVLPCAPAPPAAACARHAQSRRRTQRAGCPGSAAHRPGG